MFSYLFSHLFGVYVFFVFSFASFSISFHNSLWYQFWRSRGGDVESKASNLGALTRSLTRSHFSTLFLCHLIYFSLQSLSFLVSIQLAAKHRPPFSRRDDISDLFSIQSTAYCFQVYIMFIYILYIFFVYTNIQKIYYILAYTYRFLCTLMNRYIFVWILYTGKKWKGFFWYNFWPPLNSGRICRHKWGGICFLGFMFVRLASRAARHTLA